MAYRSPKSLIGALGCHDSALDPSTPETYTAYMSTPDACPVKAAHALSLRYLGTPTLANELAEVLAQAGGRPETILKDVVSSTLAGSGFDIGTADEAFANACAKDEGVDMSFRAAEGEWGKVFDVLRERDGVAVRRGAVASPVLERVRMEIARSRGGVEMFERAEGQVEDIKRRIEGLREGLEMEECVESATWDEVRMVVWLGALRNAEESGGARMKLLRKCRDKIRVVAALKAIEQAREKGRNEVRAFEYVSQLAAAVEGDKNVDSVGAILVEIFSVIVAGGRQGADAILRVSEVFAWIREPEPSSEGGGGESVDDDDDEVKEVREAGVVVPEQHREVLLKVIARPEVMALIWRKLFVRSAREAKGQPLSVPETVNEPLCNCLAKLLALAAVYSRRLAGGSASSKVSIAAGSDVPAARAPASPLDSTEQREQVCALESMILSCAAVCSFLPPGSAAKGISGRTKKLTPMAGPLLCGKTCSEVLRDGIGKSEVLARGVLLWAREGLLEAEIGSRLARACLQYLIVLDCIAERWSSLRGDVLCVYADAYGRVWAKETDFAIGQKFEGTFARYYGKALVSMLRFQCGIQVLDLFRGRFVARDNIAFAHLRTFVTELTSSLGLPLSASFEKALIALLTTGRVVAAFSQDPASSESENSSDSSERRDGGPAFAGISAELSFALQALKLKPPHPVTLVVGSPIAEKGITDGSEVCGDTGAAALESESNVPTVNPLSEVATSSKDDGLKEASIGHIGVVCAVAGALDSRASNAAAQVEAGTSGAVNTSEVAGSASEVVAQVCDAKPTVDVDADVLSSRKSPSVGCDEKTSVARLVRLNETIGGVTRSSAIDGGPFAQERSSNSPCNEAIETLESAAFELGKQRAVVAGCETPSAANLEKMPVKAAMTGNSFVHENAVGDDGTRGDEGSVAMPPKPLISDAALESESIPAQSSDEAPKFEGAQVVAASEGDDTACADEHRQRCVDAGAAGTIPVLESELPECRAGEEEIHSGKEKVGESKAPAVDAIAGEKEVEAKSDVRSFAVDENASVGREMSNEKSADGKELVGDTGVEIEGTGDKCMAVEKEVAANSAAEKRNATEKKIVDKEQVAGEEEVAGEDNGVQAEGAYKRNEAETKALSCDTVDKKVAVEKKVACEDKPADVNIVVTTEGDAKREGINLEGLTREPDSSPEPKCDSDIMAKYFKSGLESELGSASAALSTSKAPEPDEKTVAAGEAATSSYILPPKKGFAAPNSGAASKAEVGSVDTLPTTVPGAHTGTESASVALVGIAAGKLTSSAETDVLAVGNANEEVLVKEEKSISTRRMTRSTKRDGET